MNEPVLVVTVIGSVMVSAVASTVLMLKLAGLPPTSGCEEGRSLSGRFRSSAFTVPA